ncbi:hypothetical protein Cni_G19225 [Canna indica]|uniref:Uncharacterized protein n=1 Tax=Canna indica TaxID=4628 RepID=A0AAQ3QJI9_9LILI|nr:hypothetical protein Cni_G19225 [Canna indica]
MSSSTENSSIKLRHAACASDEEKLAFIEEMTANADAVQAKVLAEILTQNADTEYLQRYKLGGAIDRAAFKAKIPMVTYEDLRLDIRRIADGDRSPVVCADPIKEFFTRELINKGLKLTWMHARMPSSGTSAGECKLIPMTAEEWERRSLLASFCRPIVNSYIPGLDKGMGLYFMFIMVERETPGGLLARPASTSHYKSHHFRTGYSTSTYTSPLATVLCPDHFQSMYAQMLCGLVYRLRVLRLGSIFASGLLHAIRFLQLHWEQLTQDIATGTLRSQITDIDIRNAVAEVLKPDPALAELIRVECSSANWAGIVTKIWPNTKYLDTIVTGIMTQYIPALEYYGSGLPMVCTAYGSSECFCSLNLHPMSKPDEVSYTIMPFMAYFEFLPLNSNMAGESTMNAPLQLVDLVDVEVGKEYETVITTYAGLYRYRMGDILRVVGFHNTTPQFQFVRRKNVLLSIERNRTNEVELQQAVERASKLLKPWGASVLEYTSQAYTQCIPGHYVIYLELCVEEGEGRRWPAKETMEACCLEMEEAMNDFYRELRVLEGSIGPLEIRLVSGGTFEELMEDAITRGASVNQYKVPRCVARPSIIELLDSRVVETYSSPACPKWSPHQT